MVKALALVLPLFGLSLLGVTEPVGFPRVWSAHWIAPPNAGTPCTQGVFHFRRTFDAPPGSGPFVIHVSADNRYELSLNGHLVSMGPARGDLAHWRYETVDLRPFLVPERNLLSAIVWNWGEMAPFAQVTARTAFLVQGDGGAEIVNTDSNWRVETDHSRTFVAIKPESIRWQYYVAAPGEVMDASKFDWNWESPDFADRSWSAPSVLLPAYPANWRLEDIKGDAGGPWYLVPRGIPPLEERPQHFSRVRQSTVPVPGQFVRGAVPLVIGPHQRVSLLLDQDHMTTAYPELAFSGGRGSRVELCYAESLWIPGTLQKDNRDAVDGKEVRGVKDVILPDGGDHRLWRGLWWRAFRYVKVEVETSGDPLQLDDVRSTFVTYPFQQVAQFDSDSPAWFNRVLDVGRWTNRLCSQETYLDVYYEQLQYVGDTRIEALVSLYETGDARLMKNALGQLDATRDSSGLTCSRGPSRLPQFTPTFSLLWIGMLHDYWRYVDDPATVQTLLPGVRSVLSWFAGHQRADGSLRELPFYNFIDSFWKWDPKKLAPFEFQLLQAYQWAADLEEAAGNHAIADLDRTEARRLAVTLKALYWDASRGLFADDRAHTQYSQHTNSLAVLTDVASPESRRAIMESVLGETKLEPASIYFRYYVHAAAIHAGLGDRYLDWLKPWRALLDLGVTAWPENESAESRSDCHGWGDHPNIEVYRTILGVDSAGPGFSKVHIEPHLGPLTRASGAVPTPHGKVEVNYRRNADGSWNLKISTPVAGTFTWKGTTYAMSPGVANLDLP